jgi:hypothetical protein
LAFVLGPSARADIWADIWANQNISRPDADDSGVLPLFALTAAAIYRMLVFRDD